MITDTPSLEVQINNILTPSLDELRDRITISVPEAGRYLGIGRSAAFEAARAGQIPVLHLGRSLRVSVPALLKLLNADMPTT
ncbi:MAG: hypothetical protein JWP75_4154 [Frondihabitans sp.]|nr:hypothetical protein [Frondihabitans sp.]